MSKHKTKAPRRKRNPAWHALVPGGKILPSMTLEQLRAVKDMHAQLTAGFEGPKVIGYAIRAFRFLEMFGAACILENKHPALTRCHTELESLFSRDPAFAGGMFVSSWMLMDFPCGPGGATALDHFEQFLAGNGQVEHFRLFIDAARASRLGLYQSVLRSTEVARFREMFTQRVVDAYPSIEPGAPGEIVLGRIMTLDGQVYFWGEVKAFPAESHETIENMVLDRLLDAGLLDPDPSPMYEEFMKLAGPYWMSITAKNEQLPILDFDHYRSYLDEA